MKQPREIQFNNGDLSLIILLVLIFLVVIILTIFIIGYFVRRMRANINTLSTEMVNVRSEVVVGVKDKVVYKTPITAQGTSTTESIGLDDFIYALSINPESKTFRELLKLIENGATKAQLNKKFKAIEEHKILVTLKYSDNRASVAVIEIEKDTKELDEYLKLQVSESFFYFKKKEVFKEILTDDIEHLNDHKLYQAIYKDVRSIKAKGWTIVKIQNALEILPTWKDNITNTIQMTKIRFLLKSAGINSYLGKSGDVYFVQPTGRSSNHFTVSREWSNKIYSMLENNKKHYFDITSDEIRITTYNDMVKDNKSINIALMIVEILSEQPTENNSKKVLELIETRAAKIQARATLLVKEMKDGPFPMEQTTYKLKESSPKGIVEFYLDVELEALSEIIDYSFQHKRDILQFSLKEAMKRSKKYPTLITTIMFDLKNLHLLSAVTKNIPSRENFYVSIAEDGTFYTRDEMKLLVDKIIDNGYKTMQLVRGINDGDIDLTVSLRPEYILYTKDFSKIEDPTEMINIATARIKTVKDKKTKIINIK